MNNQYTKTTVTNPDKPTGKITFSSYNLPVLDDGLYKITVEQAHNLAEKYGTHYYETSASTGEGISDVFKQIALILFNAPPLYETIDVNNVFKPVGNPKPWRENCYGYVNTPSCSC